MTTTPCSGIDDPPRSRSSRRADPNTSSHVGPTEPPHPVMAVESPLNCTPRRVQPTSSVTPDRRPRPRRLRRARPSTARRHDLRVLAHRPRSIAPWRPVEGTPLPFRVGTTPIKGRHEHRPRSSGRLPGLPWTSPRLPPSRAGPGQVWARRRARRGRRVPQLRRRLRMGTRARPSRAGEPTRGRAACV